MIYISIEELDDQGKTHLSMLLHMYKFEASD